MMIRHNEPAQRSVKQAVCRCGQARHVPVEIVVPPLCAVCGDGTLFIEAPTARTALRAIALRHALDYTDRALASTGTQAVVYARIALLHADRALDLGCADCLLPNYGALLQLMDSNVIPIF